MAVDYIGRAREQFGRAAKTMAGEDLKRIFADHSAKGMLQSGGTLRVAVRTFEASSRDALVDIQAQFSARLEGRGREWKRAMTALETALNEHLAAAPKILEPAIKMAGGKMASESATAERSIVNSFEKLLGESAERLFEEQRSYRDEWTAPRGKTWFERHKLAYGAIAAIGGACLSRASDLLMAWFKS